MISSQTENNVNETKVRKKEYYSYIDGMRGVLMCLGVVLHTAQIYNPAQGWLVTDSQTSPFYGYLTEIIHLFRMPTFFLIAGFFCCMTLKRSAINSFLVTKLHRIFVPLIFVGFTLNLLQYLLLSSNKGNTLDLYGYFAQGGWVGHLWFLTNLLCYFFLAALFKLLFIDLAKLDISKPLHYFDKINLTFIFLAFPLARLSTYVLGHLGFPLYANVFGVFYISSIASYLPIFILGALLYERPNLHQKFRSVSPLISIPIIAVGFFLSEHFDDSKNIWHTTLSVYFNQLSTLASASFCFYLFHKLFSNNSTTVQRVSESSYTIYLTHHILVISLGLILAHYTLNLHIKFCIIAFSAFFLSYYFHQYVVKNHYILNYLLNGKTRKTSGKD